ncbi:MAG: CoA transferase [Alphaproteobacteria bacterium]|jgi:crotonobetainyl-CoA:carnitine CoA-transferase CaiB-like acyl-CoA transferase|nr:CoA transferase [Alphaproteobacteria bacterium]
MLDLLDGVRVLSFNHFLLGPVGIQVLGDLGADVIAVESLDGAFQRQWAGADTWVDGQSVLMLCGGRNKRSLAIDLRSEAGRAIVLQLADRSDVVTENFRPGVMERLGLGYEALSARNPALIYASASGYGPDGPYVDRPGQDLLIQAISGLAAITGSAESGPRPVGVSATDHHGAALLAQGILAALFRRERTGKGCRVDVDLLSAALDMQMESIVAYMNGPREGDVSAPAPVAGWYYGAPYGIYAAADGHLAISLTSLETLAEALETPALADYDARQQFSKRAELATAVADAVAGRTLAELVARLDAHKVWNMPVADYDDLARDPQVAHNGSLLTVPGATGTPITLLNHPNRFDGEVAEVRLPPQPLGAQTAEVLAELGYDSAAIRQLAADGVVRLHDDEAGRA